MVDTMTSWFSVSDALTRVAVMVCVVCVTGGQLGAVQGTLHILQCSAHGWMDVREDVIPYFVCNGFSAEQTVKWRIVRNNTVTANATCGPVPTPLWLRCSKSSGIEVSRFDGRSELRITSNPRQLASNGRVDCYVDDNTAATTCRTNVIYPALLFHCGVTMTTHETLAGICIFNIAYSSNGTYTCTWILTPTDGQGNPDVIIPGNITKTEQPLGSELYYRGACSFTRQIPRGHYNYTVSFFPVIPGRQYQGSVNVTAADQSSSNDAYIAGGVVASVVVIVAVVVVVVLVRRHLGRRLYDRPRRRQRRQPEEHPYAGLDVYETVGQPAPSTSHVQGTAQSVYEISDQESAPGVDLRPAQLSPRTQGTGT